MLAQFHFLEPLWLLALLPLIVVFLLAFQTTTSSKAWERVIDARLLPLLLQGKDKNISTLPKFLLATTWVLAVSALADPAWEKIKKPIFQTNAARVIVLDLSNSMLIDDLKPSRIARARFKIEDILSLEEEGQTGLVLFAGEAFTAVPLTRDVETIRAMLKVLTPQIMPAQGSRADLGLIKAQALFKQAGIVNGQILLIADGVSQKAASLKVAKDLLKDGHTVSVMAVGTEQGGKLNFSNNTSKTIKLDAKSLHDIANNGGGNYHLITSNNTDLKRLLISTSNNSSLTKKQTNTNTTNGKDKQEIQSSEWHSTGPLLVLILLPFAALAFRRGWLLNVLATTLFVGLASQPQEVMAAQDEAQNSWQSFVQQLTKNKAQRANQAFIHQQYEKARDLSSNSFTRGNAQYKLEDYQEALDSFKQAKGADARFNEGNALAKLQSYKEAIVAYDDALTLNPSMQDASDNKKAIEDFLKKQQSSDKKEQSDNNQQGNSNSQSEQQGQQSETSQDKQNEAQSASKDGDQEDRQEESQGDNHKEQQNQFSDANKEIDKNKKNAEEEEIQDAENPLAKKDDGKQNKVAEDPEIATTSENNVVENTKKEKRKNLAEELSQEERIAAEQWLRRIPDDPGGLLRRKFRHQYNQSRRNSNKRPTEQPW